MFHASRKLILASTYSGLLLLLSACGHTYVSKVGLLSVGDLEGRSLPARVEGPVLEGSDSGHMHYLSNAVRDALKGTDYDTLLDAEVTTTTGVFVWSNKVEVKGLAVKSSTLPLSGGTQ